MTIIIMSWNWLTSLQKQCEFFTECGHSVVIVDNCSTYPPLLEFLKTCGHKVVSTEGVELSTYNRFVWEIPGLLDDVGEFYGVTDSDIGFQNIPKDFCEILISDIERSPGIIKCGLGIEIENLPRNIYHRQSFNL